jgi:uncharacterized protein YkwD
MRLINRPNARYPARALAPVLGAMMACAAVAPATGASDTSPPLKATLKEPWAIELAMLDEINAPRTNPHAYAVALRGDIARFHDLIYQAPGREDLETVEGAAAVKEAIADLEARAPAPPLTADSAIGQAALRLVADQSSKGGVGHVDSRGARLSDRLEAAGVWANSMAEDIAYGESEPREAVRELIVDDGVPDRAHRKAIFDATMTRVGFAGGPHPELGWMWVIDFTSPTMPANKVKSASARNTGSHGAADPMKSGEQTASSR